MRRPLRRRASLAVSWQLCQGNDTTTVFGDLVRSHFDRLRSPLQTLKPLAPQGLALAVQTISKNGSSEIRTQDQSVKSQLDIAEIPCCARAQETTPKHSPKQIGATGETILADKQPYLPPIRGNGQDQTATFGPTAAPVRDRSRSFRGPDQRECSIPDSQPHQSSLAGVHRRGLRDAPLMSQLKTD